MKIWCSNAFDKNVARFFAPLAARASLNMSKLREGIYQIDGPTFVLRIRRGTGHRSDLLVTLLARSSMTENLDDLSHEIGLGVIAEYNQRPLRAREISSHQDWATVFEEAADAVQEFCVPYLLDLRDDIAHIWEFIERKIRASGVHEQNNQFPKNVREEWL